MRERNKSRFKLTWGEEDTAAQTDVEEFFETLEVATIGGGKIGHRLIVEEECKHRADRLDLCWDFFSSGDCTDAAHQHLRC